MTSLPPDPLAQGLLLAGKYRIGERVGAGGMGIVYAAVHEELRMRVAVKVMQPALAKEPRAIERFLREARLAATIESVHCTRTLDVGSAHEGPYLVMEYLAGEALDRRLQRCGPLRVTDTCTLLLQALDAVAEAHHRGLVHRDLKPGNLFLSERVGGELWVKVLDFGISKSLEPDSDAHGESQLTGPRSLLGSPHYMAPEQLRDASTVTARTDVWAFGVLLLELATGQLPFRGPSLADLYASIVSAEPSWPSSGTPLPPRLVTLIRACLEKDPAARPDDAQLAHALAQFARRDARPIATRIASLVGDRAPLPRARPRRSTHLIGAGLVACAAVGAFAAASWRPRSVTSAAAATAPAPATSVSHDERAAPSARAEASAPAPAAPASIPAKGAKPAKRRIQNLSDIELLE